MANVFLKSYCPSATGYCLNNVPGILTSSETDIGFSLAQSDCLPLPSKSVLLIPDPEDCFKT